MDRTRPYVEVCGLPGVAFQQDGKLYTPDGRDAAPQPYEEEPPPPEDNDIGVGPAMVATSAPPADDWETMKWPVLKTLVETYGGNCKSRAEAIEFLRGKPK